MVQGPLVLCVGRGGGRGQALGLVYFMFGNLPCFQLFICFFVLSLFCLFIWVFDNFSVWFKFGLKSIL